MNSIKTKITKRVVDTLGPHQMVWDAGDGSISGFGVRRQRRDAVYFVKTRAGARQRWVTIGRHGPWSVDQARKQARVILGDVARGNDPGSHLGAKAPKLDDIMSRFLSEEVETKRAHATAILYRDLWERLAKSRLGQHLVGDVTFADVAALHHQFRTTPVTANRLVAVLSSLFSWCERHGLRQPRTNPAFGIQKFPEKGRERFLTPDELARLGSVLDAAEANKSESPYTLAAIRLLIFTGCRRNEILTLRWDNLDLERGCIFLKETKTGARTVHLSAPAIAVIKSISRLQDNPFVIAGEREGQHLVNLRKPWLRISAAAMIEGVRLHDLRHSFASVGVSDGLSLPVIGKLLGHTKASTTMRYSHLAADPVKQANDAIGLIIARSLAGGARSDEIS